MTRKARIWGATILLLVLWLALAWLIPEWMSLLGKVRWVVSGLLAFIGAFAAVFTAVYMTRRPPPPPVPPDPLSQEVEASLGQVERRIAESGMVKGRALQRMPVIFVLGGRQQQKTSTVIRSGARAEQLAGEALQGMRVNPTQALNVWLARPALLVEPGVDVLQDPARRARLWHRFQPARLADAVTRGEQAPRAALVCVSVESIRGQGQGAAAGRDLRQTVAEIAHVYGVRLPLYVAFTAADAVAGFKEFTKHLPNDDIREVLGATFPLPPDVPASTYAEFASARVRESLGAILRSLSARRHVVLTLLTTPADRAAAYEFPRELAKLEGEMVDFLVELARPSELQVSPFVRGFYVTGVREVVVAEGSPVPVAHQPEPADVGGGATALLSSLPRSGGGLVRGPASAGAARREPQWVFLDRLFSGVLLNDPVAFSVTRGGARVSYFRRLVLGAGLGIATLLLLAVTVSFVRNMTLAGRVAERIRAAAAIPAEPSRIATVAHLALLDSLGQSLDEVSEHVHVGTPWSLRWGLSRSARLYGPTRTSYFRHFGALLFTATQQRVVDQLRVLPREPLGGSEYEKAYGRLKAHLITTQYHDSSTVDFLSPVLLADWPGYTSGDTVATPLARRHFDRLARELAYDDVYRGRPDPAAVQAARAAINLSSGDQPIYQALIAEASRRAPEFRFGSLQSAGLRTVSVPEPVPGAFTVKGWDIVHAGLGNIDRYLKREVWVVGPDAPPLAMSRDSLVQVLRARYDSAYGEHWRALLRSASVVRFSNLSDATTRLGSMAGSASELLLLLAAINSNIPADSHRVARWFTSVRSIGAPKLGSILTTDAMKPYQGALSTLGSKTSNVPALLDAQALPILTDALNATVEVNNQVQAIAAPLNRLEWQDLALGTLLEQPGRYANALLKDAIAKAGRTAGAAGAEQAGADYCRVLSPLTSKRPFVERGEDVTAEELATVFGPNSPLRGLAQAVQETGPSPEARQYLARLRAFSEALYAGGSNEAVIRFRIAPDGSEQARTIALSFGGRRETWQGGQSDLRAFTWNFAVDNSVAIEIGQSGVDLPGPWALKSFFGPTSATEWRPEGGGVYHFRETDTKLGFRVAMSVAAASVLRGEIFAGDFRCPTKWTSR